MSGDEVLQGMENAEPGTYLLVSSNDQFRRVHRMSLRKRENGTWVYLDDSKDPVVPSGWVSAVFYTPEYPDGVPVMAFS